jgi:tRNA(fMet)-specific endonuclease VapC
VIFIDTDVAIALRDVHPETHSRIADLGEIPVVSMITRIKLENGVNREPAGTNYRRRLLDTLLRTISVEMSRTPTSLLMAASSTISGYDRRRTLDRLIAAQAIARDARLITCNGRDFAKIEGLRLEVWPPITPSRAGR